MKKIIILLSLSFSLAALASLEANDLPPEATASEISASRSCFQELKNLGCGHPTHDREHFRACMSNSFGSLSSSCKKMMSELYGKR